MRRYVKPVLLSIAASTLALVLLPVAIPSSRDYAPDNPYWNGFTRLAGIVNATFKNAGETVLDPGLTILFIIGPEENITDSHVSLVKAFLENGGTVVLMDETGVSNRLLESLNIDIKIGNRPMLDPVFYEGSWRLPKTTGLKSWMSSAGEIVMNTPSTLEPGLNTMVIAYSSPFSFLDLNGDGEYTSGEPSGPFPVAAEAAFSRGRIIVFTDSSMFLNSMVEKGGNMKLLKNIVGDGVMVVDTSLWQTQPRDSLKKVSSMLLQTVSTPEARYAAAIMLAAAAYVWASSTRPRGEVGELQQVLEKHPDWNPELLKALEEARRNVLQ
ncbi:MAG: DUF4350 domain-containing protein [Thermoproteota archaeon]|nr:DUF4350 domain-containing protein [Candidatus Brockarchaeota archaeon]